MPRRLLLAATTLLLLAPATTGEAAKARKERKPRTSQAQAAGSIGCAEPAAADPALAAGLDLYAAGRWADAATALLTWSEAAGAEQDPAAAKGFYSLAYALRAARGANAGIPALARAEALLVARTAESPTLEAWYYLQGVHQMRGNTQAQLETISKALQALDAGSLCKTPAGDDWFRIARLHGFAGNSDRKAEALRAAAAAYDALPADAPASASAYRALVSNELGEAALVSNDLVEAERHLAVAARLDPTIPGVHRQLGLVYLRRGKLAEASSHWRLNWKRERQGGNAFMYGIALINKVLVFRARPGFEPVAGLSQYTLPALEQNATQEAKRYFELATEDALARDAGTTLPPERAAEMRQAEERSLQFLLEYLTRGNDLQEFALQNGLLPLIHGRGLPSR